MTEIGIDWVGVVGILGTLGGVVVGAITTYKIQERQLNHLDETRFHEQRLTAYQNFSASTIQSVSHWKTGGHNADSVNQVFESLELIRLVAGESVGDSAIEVNIVFGEIFALEDKSQIPDELNSRLDQKMIIFNNAARTELKTGNT